MFGLLLYFYCVLIPPQSILNLLLELLLKVNQSNELLFDERVGISNLSQSFLNGLSRLLLQVNLWFYLFNVQANGLFLSFFLHPLHLDLIQLSPKLIFLTLQPWKIDPKLLNHQLINVLSLSELVKFVLFFDQLLIFQLDLFPLQHVLVADAVIRLLEHFQLVL